MKRPVQFRITLGLSALLHLPCPMASPGAPIAISLPCTDSSQPVTQDTHVFFPDDNLERLALRLSSSLYADDSTYHRLARDVALIRDRKPELRSVHYLATHDVRVLNVYFSTRDFWRVRMHLYKEWRCLNDFLGAQTVLHPEFEYVELTFVGLYNPDIVSEAYRTLPGVQTTEFVGRVGDGSNIFVSRDATVWHYVFDIAGGDCPSGCTEHTLYYFETSTDGRLKTNATWTTASKETAPDWATAYFRQYR